MSGTSYSAGPSRPGRSDLRGFGRLQEHVGDPAEDRLIGVSPDAAALRLELGGYLSTGSSIEMVLLGGGGASRAIALVSSALPQVRRITITEIDARRRDELKQWAEKLKAHGVERRIDILAAEANDEVTSNASEGALIVNASGMGKDMAGSPISRKVKFPRGSVVWDMNYRGELAFLAYAYDQAETRDLRVRDGFALFIRNWTWLLESILGKTLDDQARTVLWKTTQVIRNRG